MDKVISVDDLGEYISEILQEYGDRAQFALETAAAGVGKAASNKVRAAAPEKKGTYKKGWTVSVEKDRIGVEAVVYNRSRPGFTQLLEKGHEIYGHALRSGGRTTPRAFPHIAPAEQWAVEEFVKRVEKELKA